MESSFTLNAIALAAAAAALSPHTCYFTLFHLNTIPSFMVLTDLYLQITT